MKRTYKSIMGVTLLEIMLVLAIAALVIVMSIRFYSSASNSQKINTMVSLVTALNAAAESCAAANDSSLTNCTNLANYMPNGVMPRTPWGGTITQGSVGGSGTTVAFTLNPALGTGPAAMFTNALAGNPKVVTPSASGWTYDISK
jgi:Tfp pilus assembly protein FimT